MLLNHIERGTLTAIRDALPRDTQERHFALRRKAVDLRMPVVDLERALAALPEPAKLSRDERDAADLRARRRPWPPPWRGIRRHRRESRRCRGAAQHPRRSAVSGSGGAGRQSPARVHLRDGERLRG